MKYFRYIIQDDEVTESKGEVGAIPTDFIESKTTLTGQGAYYKSVNGKITEVIGEGIHEPAARRRVDEFLSAFEAPAPGAW